MGYSGSLSSQLAPHSVSYDLRSQEYVSSPLLLDPAPDSNTHGTKFHLRVYVLAVGGLAVYVHHPYLALFASSPYQPPAASASESGEFDLSAHLTNTCLQTSVLGEEASTVSVSTLQSMADKVILGGPHEGEQLGEERISRIEEGVREAVAEVFKAAVGAGSSFQVRALLDTALRGFVADHA